MPRHLAPVLLVPLVLVFLAGCGEGRVSATDVARAAGDALQQRVGARPDIHCPHDLPAEVGASIRCTLDPEDLDVTYGVTVTVTSVHGERASFDVQVDQAPQR